MSVAQILVPVTGSMRDGVALATAFEAARPFNAHVKVLFVHADPREAIPYSDMPLSSEIAQQLVDTADTLAKAAAKSARTTLAKVAGEAGVKIVADPRRAASVTVSYKEVVGHLPACVAEEARLCDLVVFPALAKGDTAIHDSFIAALTKTERPTLLCAAAGAKHVGRKIAIGWDGGIAAAHALTAALPYLAKAEAIEILSVRHLASPERGSDEVGAYLGMHGLGCSQRLIEQGQGNVADILLEAATNSGCDLLVIGGYGHSRLGETIFGGVTRSIVSHPSVPILMMH